jgi:CPA2 family monovalent cation:H+ antiporter-2
MHHTPLIATIVAGLALAFVFGALAHRLRASPIVGYLIAGVVIGPFTPGYVADQGLATELSEIGVILLMFGVGLHFSIKELWAVRNIAVPGAVVQIVVATSLGAGLAHALGWSAGAGLVFGLALSVASTVVLLRALQERRLVNTERGQIAVGWLIVEDLVMVLTLVLLPAVAPLLGGQAAGQATSEAVGASALDLSGILLTAAVTVGKVAAFVAIMMVVGRRIIPWILHYTAHTGSRELFRLAVLSIALGVAYIAAHLFGVSFALGAFFAGLVLSESPLSQQAANESLPLRDAFAVLFFVSVGMLFDPGILIDRPWAVAATLLIIVIGKSLAALAIVRAFGYSLGTAFTISASLAQIGEFSFILAALGTSLDLLPAAGRDLILAGALLSIVLNPLFFVGLDRLKPWLERKDASHAAASEAEAKADEEPVHVTALERHTIVIGIGRVGKRLIDALVASNTPLYVIDESEEEVKRLHARNIEGLAGSATTLLHAANPAKAAALIIAIPGNFEAGEVIEQARIANPAMPIIGRAQNEPEAEYLRRYGATHVAIASDTLADALLASYLNAVGS